MPVTMFNCVKRYHPLLIFIRIDTADRVRPYFAATAACQLIKILHWRQTVRETLEEWGHWS